MIKLMRGLPGSGKTTKALDECVKGYVHIESDMWFTINGIYEYNSYEMGNAHQWCVSTCEYHVRKHANVVVANTFTTMPECAPYFVIARKYGISIVLETCTGQFKSIHGVPDEIMLIMKERFVSDSMVHETIPSNLALFYSSPYDIYYYLMKKSPVS